MSPVTVSKQRSAPSIAPGSYVLELTGVRQVAVDDLDHPGQKVERIELDLAIRDHPRWGGARFTDLATPLLGPRSKLGQVVTALRGGVEPPDGELDLEDYVGHRFQATVRRKENGFNAVVPDTALPLEGTDASGR